MACMHQLGWCANSQPVVQTLLSTGHTCIAVCVDIACILVIPIRKANAVQTLCDAAHCKNGPAASAVGSSSAGSDVSCPASCIRRNVVQVVVALRAEGLKGGTLSQAQD
jgi:hypothetical protein